MLNIEKYKDDINDAINDCYVEDILCEINENIMGEHPNVDCYSGSEMCENCQKNVMKWLLEEYKEPILTDKEKACLKKIIKSKRDSVIYIRKTAFLKGTENEFTNIVIATKGTLEAVATPDMPFEGMKLEREYSLEELGL